MLRCCRSCGLEAHTTEELASFVRGKDNTHGRKQLCKQCKNAEANKDYSRTRNNFLRSRYGITLDDYNDMFAKQRGCCAICETHQSELKKRLYVDHCHDSRQVRQLLCQHCNTLLGFAKDDIQILSNAIIYINKHKE